MLKGITIAGNMLVDKIKTVRTYPTKGLLADITSLDTCVGGCVPNTAISLAKIDHSLPLSVLGRVGDDNDGKYLIQKLAESGIDVSQVILGSTSTSFTDVITESETGERTFFHHRGANAEFSPDDICIHRLNCAFFHIGYILLLDQFDKPDVQYGTSMARFLSLLRAKGIKTSIDLVSDNGDRFQKVVPPSLPYCDYVMINEIEAGKVAAIDPRNTNGQLNEANIKKIMQVFLDLGVQEKMIIHCPECGYCLDKLGTFTAVPSLCLPKGYIVGSVGAGDAFGSGCLYALYNHFDDEKMLRFASCCAAANLSCKDSISGMTTADKIWLLEKKYKRG